MMDKLKLEYKVEDKTFLFLHCKHYYLGKSLLKHDAIFFLLMIAAVCVLFYGCYDLYFFYFYDFVNFRFVVYLSYVVVVFVTS